MIDKSKIINYDQNFSPKNPLKTETKLDRAGSLKKKPLSKTSTKSKPTPLS